MWQVGWMHIRKREHCKIEYTKCANKPNVAFSGKRKAFTRPTQSSRTLQLETIGFDFPRFHEQSGSLLCYSILTESFARRGPELVRNGQKERLRACASLWSSRLEFLRYTISLDSNFCGQRPSRHRASLIFLFSVYLRSAVLHHGRRLTCRIF